MAPLPGLRYSTVVRRWRGLTCIRWPLTSPSWSSGRVIEYILHTCAILYTGYIMSSTDVTVVQLAVMSTVTAV